MLTDVEKYVLSSCVDQNVGALVARDIISHHLGRKLTLRDMRKAYERLFELGLVEPLTGRHGSRREAPIKGTRTRDFSFKATPEGILYLQQSRSHEQSTDPQIGDP